MVTSLIYNVLRDSFLANAMIVDIAYNAGL